MKIKNFILKTFLTATLFITPATPAFAGEVDLQTEIPLYTVNENMNLTDEEQRALDKTVNYFLENPDAEYIVLTNDEFPNLSLSWYNNFVAEKLDCITDDFPIINGNGYLIPGFLTYAESSTTCNKQTSVLIKSHMKQALEIKNFVDYSYSLLPKLGIYDGMDDRQALCILNNFVMSHLTYDENFSGDYIHSYATQKGVCFDYALLFKALCRGAGIDCDFIASNSENHAWNRVCIDNQYYEIDTLWNQDSNGRNDLFMLSREQMSNFNRHKNPNKIF